MYKNLIIAIACLYLAGCSFQGVKPPSKETNNISWEEQQALLKNYIRWELSGKVGIRTPQDSQSASLTWLQTDTQYQIDIHGPWGQGGASIIGEQGEVTVNVSGGKQFKGSDPELILYKELGWQLPINDIYWWIRGLPSPTATYEHQLENNRLKNLKQRGWDIQYLRYNSLSPALPNKLRFIRDDLTITVVVSNWIKR